MKIDSPRFGTLTVEPAKIIEFPEGLAGFEECRRFTLFHPETDEPKYFILQSLDDPALAFHITDPARLGFNFEVALSDAEMAVLKLSDPQDAVVTVMLLKDGKGDGDGPIRANLIAPLIINIRERRGLQHIFEKLNYPLAS